MAESPNLAKWEIGAVFAILNPPSSAVVFALNSSPVCRILSAANLYG
jgi:hypothetical protein